MVERPGLLTALVAVPWRESCLVMPVQVTPAPYLAPAPLGQALDKQADAAKTMIVAFAPVLVAVV
jgi:hypothetical protein